jgi:hypothetical protein
MSIRMMLWWLMSVSVISRSILDLPILRRIAKDDSWPPIRIYIYPLDSFPPGFHRPLAHSRFSLEAALPSLIRQSPLYVASPHEADLYLVPLNLSSFSLKDFESLLHFLPQLGPFYDEYHGTNHIFLHGAFPLKSTAINENNIHLHPAHVFTSGYAILPDPIKTWSYAKNFVMPLAPTVPVVSHPTKKMQIAVNLDLTHCTADNKEGRRHVAKLVSGKASFAVAHDDATFVKLMAESAFSLVTSCESHIPWSFYDAINALSVPIVVSDVMRFPFEMELIDYTGFIVHVNESEPDIDVLGRLGKYLPKMQKHMAQARKMLQPTTKNGEYIWAIGWSLYMKYLAWVPIRRNKIFDNIFREPLVFVAQ